LDWDRIIWRTLGEYGKETSFSIIFRDLLDQLSNYYLIMKNSTCCIYLEVVNIICKATTHTTEVERNNSVIEYRDVFQWPLYQDD
jgi:hypothetical protein